MISRRTAAAAVALAVSVGGAVGTAGTGSAAPTTSERPSGDIRVFARVPAPGEPSLTLVTPNQKRVYVGTFEDLAGDDTSPSKVFAYSASGRLLHTYAVKGQTPGQPHGVQVAARDQQGRLYLLDQKPSRVVRLNPRTGGQHTYATFTDVPTCAKPTDRRRSSTQCSNTASDGAPEPDYAAWLPDGAMLVTDYSQQLIWRVPPHGGKARVWLNDKRFDGELFGPAGIVLAPGRRSVLVSVATGGVTTVDPSSPATNGRLYRVRLGRDDRAGELTTLWTSAPAQAPDGFAISHDRRHIYIAEAGPTANCVDELVHAEDGRWHLVQRIPGERTSGSTATWDTATSVQFLHRSILVTNQSYFTGTASHWMVFDVKVPFRGLPIYVPAARLTRG